MNILNSQNICANLYIDFAALPLTLHFVNFAFASTEGKAGVFCFHLCFRFHRVLLCLTSAEANFL